MNYKYFLRVIGNEFTFVAECVHSILKTDIEITNEDYENWKYNSSFKSYRLKKVITGSGLFGYIEDYIPTTEDTPYVPTLVEKNRSDIDYLSMMMGVDL